MRIENGAFYMARVSGTDTIHQTEDGAIDHLREQVDGVDPEDPSVSIVEVSVDGEDWTIKELPWQRVAVRLMQEG